MASFGNFLLVVAYYSLMLRKYFLLGFPAVEVFTSISDFLFLFFRDAILWNKLELRIFFYHFTSFFFMKCTFFFMIFYSDRFIDQT